MSRLTRRGMHNGLAGFWVKENDGSESFISWQDDGYDGIAKLAHYEDLEEQGVLMTTHQAVVILTEVFGNEHPCNFNRIDEWFPEACNFADLCPDGKMSAIACWEQYVKIKLAELKGGAE